MRRTVLFSCLVAGAVGCRGKEPTAPAHRGPKVAHGGDPGAGRPEAVSPRTSVPELRPRAAFRTGKPHNPLALTFLFLDAAGGRLAVGLGETALTQIWDVRGEPRKLAEFPGGVSQFSPGGNLLVRRVYVRPGVPGRPVVARADTGEPVCTLEDPVTQYAFRSDAALVAVWRAEPGAGVPAQLEVREYDTATGRRTGSFPAPPGLGPDLSRVVVQLGLSGGREVAFGAERLGRVEVWDVAAQKEVRGLALADPVPSGSSWAFSTHFAVSGDGRWVALDSGKGLRIVDAGTGAPVAVPPPGALARRFVPARDVYLSYFSSDGPAARRPKGFEAFDLNRKAAVAVLPSTGVADAFSADGKVMVTDSEDGELRVWDLTQLP